MLVYIFESTHRIMRYGRRRGKKKLEQTSFPPESIKPKPNVGFIHPFQLKNHVTMMDYRLRDVGLGGDNLGSL